MGATTSNQRGARQMEKAIGFERKKEQRGCGLKLKERVDGNVTGLIDLSIN